MRIAIDISPLQSGHKIRGVGFYLENLKKSLLKYHPENEYIFFERKEKIDTRVDLIHYPYFEPFFISLPFFEQKKIVVTIHDLTPLVFPEHFPSGIKGKIFWHIQKLNLKRSAALIADSQSSKKDIIKFTQILPEKVTPVYLAAGEEFQPIINKESKIKDLKKRYNLPDKFALYVGDVTWNKNLPNLVAAIKRDTIPLVMVGKSLVETNFDRTNIWNSDLIKVQKETEGDNRFIKLGFVSSEDLVALYNAASVFIFPSVYEGFGLPVLEAMQSGCPVITTKGGSLAEVAGDAAFFVDGSSSEEIAKGLHEVFTKEKLQNDLRIKGIAQAKTFNWEQTAKQTIDVYKKVLATR